MRKRMVLYNRRHVGMRTLTSQCRVGGEDTKGWYLALRGAFTLSMSPISLPQPRLRWEIYLCTALCWCVAGTPLTLPVDRRTLRWSGNLEGGG